MVLLEGVTNPRGTFVENVKKSKINSPFWYMVDVSITYGHYLS
jgi:hypothetical protein